MSISVNAYAVASVFAKLCLGLVIAKSDIRPITRPIVPPDTVLAWLPPLSAVRCTGRQHDVAVRLRLVGQLPLTMASTRLKRSSKGGGGRGGGPPKKKISRKERRILEPASPHEIACEEKKGRISAMNWKTLGRTNAQQNAQNTDRSNHGAVSVKVATSEQASPWKQNTLPREGDKLKCRHFSVCPGCELDRDFDQAPVMIDSTTFFDSLHAAAARKREGFSERTVHQFHVIHDWKPHGWRTVAKLAAKPVTKWGGVELGLYRLGTHDVVDIPDCRVHHPSINLAAKAIAVSAKKVKITSYRPESGEGALRYVQIAVERTSGQVQLTLVWNAESFRDAIPHLQLLAKDLRVREPTLFHSIWANFRTGDGNNILNRGLHSWHRCSGPEYVKEVLGPSKLPFFFSPPLFRQANLDHFEGIIAAVVDWVPEGCAVSELYSGVGVLGLNCAAKASSVRCSDVNAFNPRSFERTRRTLPPEIRSRVSFEALSAEDAIESGEVEDSDVLIVDPPRKGLDTGVLQSLADPDNMETCSLRRIIYVSCGIDALKRDTIKLIASGWILRHSEGFVLFPGSNHIETLAVFDRIPVTSSLRQRTER